jgi:probable DNA metabolism protein
MHGHPTVLAIEKLSQKVSYEAHRMLGFVRFQHQTAHFYYAEIAPDHCILPLITTHFKTRMADQDWVIHDSKRHIAAVYSSKRQQCVLTSFSNEQLQHCTLSDSEKIFASLWSNYHKTLAISERTNNRLQRQFVPMRYRQHLTEFNQPT